MSEQSGAKGLDVASVDPGSPNTVRWGRTTSCCGPGSPFAATQTPEEARRIAAALNATLGLPTEALESGALAKALDLLERGLDRIGFGCAVCHGGSSWTEVEDVMTGGITHEKGCELAAVLHALGRL